MIRVRVSLSPIVALAFVGISFGGTPSFHHGDEDNYWRDQSVVLATVLRTQTSDGLTQFVLRPIGTVAGPFDAATFPEINDRVRLTRYRLPSLPQEGNLVLVVLAADQEFYGNYRRQDQLSVKYSVLRTGADYMPPPGTPISVVKGIGDSRVGKTLSAIQGLRTKPPVREGRGDTYWREHSLIVGEVEYFYPISFGPSWKPRILVRLVGTLSGNFDAAMLPLISVEWNYAMRDEIGARRPRANDKVLLVVQRTDRVKLGWDSPEGWSAYMPGNHESFHIVKGIADREVEATLKAVQALRNTKDR